MANISELLELAKKINEKTEDINDVHQFPDRKYTILGVRNKEQLPDLVADTFEINLKKNKSKLIPGETIEFSV